MKRQEELEDYDDWFDDKDMNIEGFEHLLYLPEEEYEEMLDEYLPTVYFV